MKRNIIAILSIFTAGTMAVSAQAANTYALDTVVITAQRNATEDLKTPAAVTVLSSDDLSRTGATAMQEALKFTTGIIVHAQGPRNISRGINGNKAVIRGVETGTLVLLDGVPLNQSGRYNLEDIPVSIVDHVEVIRGGGAVLYGSEAMGGVINIITKGTRENRIQVSAGNYGLQNHLVSFQTGKLGTSVSYDHTGHIDHISDPTTASSGHHAGQVLPGVYYNILRGEHTNMDWRYNFNDDLYFTHMYGRNSSHYVYRYDGQAYAPNTGAAWKNTLHHTEEHIAALHYQKEDLKAQIFYNRRNQYTENFTAVSHGNPAAFDPSHTKYDRTSYLDESVGVELSNRWHFGAHSFLFGGNFQRDLLDRTDAKDVRKSYSRNMYSLFSQFEYYFNARTFADLNLRETWTEKDGAGNQYEKFTPELVLLHQLDPQTSVYAKAGKSFMMPTFSQLYGSGNVVANPFLKPQNGTHYELGWKKNIGSQSWRIALYHYRIKDNISIQFQKTTGLPDSYVNEDIKNTGLEVDWTLKSNDNLSYHLGLSYSHPEKKSSDVKVNGGRWHDYYGKLGLNGDIVYTSGKLTSALSMSYLGDRIRDSNNNAFVSFKPQLLTDLNLSYQANADSRIFLNIDNLLDRQDIVSSSDANFYHLGRNFLLGYEYKF